MTKEVLYLELDSELKAKVRKLAVAERRTMTSFILLLIDKKISEVENGKSE